MTTILKTILISRRPDVDCADIAEQLQTWNFNIIEHDLGSVPEVDFEDIEAALILVDRGAVLATAQTRRWRVELGDSYRPILWISEPVKDDFPLATESGADDCLPRTCDPELLRFRIDSAQRIRNRFEELRTRANEATLWANKLKSAQELRAHEQSVAHGILHSMTAQPREIGTLRFEYPERRHDSGGTQFLDVSRSGQDVRLAQVEVHGDGGPITSLIGLMILHLVRSTSSSPADVVQVINSYLLTKPLSLLTVSVAIVDIESHSGSFQISLAGMPPPIHVRSAGTVEMISKPNPHLGIFEIKPSLRSGVIAPGEMLMLYYGGHLVSEPQADHGRSAQEVLSAITAQGSAMACRIERIA